MTKKQTNLQKLSSPSSIWENHIEPIPPKAVHKADVRRRRELDQVYSDAERKALCSIHLDRELYLEANNDSRVSFPSGPIVYSPQEVEALASMAVGLFAVSTVLPGDVIKRARLRRSLERVFHAYGAEVKRLARNPGGFGSTIAQATAHLPPKPRNQP